MCLFKMKVQLYHSHEKTNKKGLVPIILRLSMDSLPKDMSTGIFVAKEHFNGFNVIKIPKAQQHNAILGNIVRDFECIINDKNLKKIRI